DRRDQERGRDQRSHHPPQPLRAAHSPPRRPHRSRGHDDLAQGGQGAGRPLRHQAGVRGALQVRGAGGPRQDRGRARPRLPGHSSLEYANTGYTHSDRVALPAITDPTAPLASLRSGDLHMIERASASDLAQIRGDSKLKVVGVPELGYQMMPLNVNNGPKGNVLGADPRIRQAIDLAIDRETIVKTIFAN